LLRPNDLIVSDRSYLRQTEKSEIPQAREFGMTGSVG
jgi:hypothetical protein